MGFKKRKKNIICESCGTPKSEHFHSWVDGLAGPFLSLFPEHLVPENLEKMVTRLLEGFLVFVRVLSLEENFTEHDVTARSYCFIQEGRKRGLSFSVLRGPSGFMNYYQMLVNKKKFSFEGLPVAEFANKFPINAVDDKLKTKKRLIEGKFPVLPSRSFWVWQKKSALRYGKNIGFPLVVKPRNGSYSRHVITNIVTESELKKAINLSLEYSPTFVVERYLGNTSVFRATVVDFDYVACVERAPANVVGDGKNTIQELVNIKNLDSNRGDPDQEEFTLFKLVVDGVTEKLLAKKNLTLSSVLPNGEKIVLQQDPFIRLGADSNEVTNYIHPDNKKLFIEIAKYFDVRVVGLDFLCADITKSWKIQDCAVLELNSLPCIEVHHFPSSGEPQNVAGKIVDLVLKYYK